MLRYNCYNNKNMRINVALRGGITNYIEEGRNQHLISLFSVVEKAGRPIDLL